MKNKLFHVHVPKTAGTTINIFLASKFERTFTHAESHLNQLDLFLDSHNFISGHISYSRIKDNKNLKTCTKLIMFREPYSYVVSHLCWIRKLADKGHEARFAATGKKFQEIAIKMKSYDFSRPENILKFNDWLQEINFNYLHNTQTYFLDEKKDMNTALKNLDDFEIIGTSENIKATMDKLSDLFNWNKESNESPRHNENSNKYGFDLSNPETKKALYPFIDKDLKLYEFVTNPSDNKKKRKKISSIKCKDINQKQFPESLPISSSPLRRADLIKIFSHIQPALEIGPFDRPMIRGNGISYFDVLDQAGLIKKASLNPRRCAENVPFIDFVSPIGDLSVVDKIFASACSSHSIEHQPDLIKHLHDVTNILENNGYYYLAIPDKRFCLDHYNSESSIADILEAQERKVHSLANIIRCLAMHTHNDVIRHWANDHKNPGYLTDLTSRVEKALQTYNASNGSYIDVHAWYFTPQSFQKVMQTLYELNFSPLKPIRVYETPKNCVEFLAVLQKS